MSVGVLTEEMKKRQSTILKALEVWIILGLVAGLALYFILEPTSEVWGVSFSPERSMMMAGFMLVAALPMVIWGIYYYSTNQKWLAEDLGVPYEPGKRYPCWTSRRIVAIGLGIALFGISGIVPAFTFDLPQFVATFLTVMYGPIAGALGSGLGHGLIRGPLFRGTLNPFVLIAYTLADACYPAILGIIYRKYIAQKPFVWRATIGLVIYFLVIDRLHHGFLLLGYPGWGVMGELMRYGPLEVALAKRVFFTTYWVPVAFLPNVVIAYTVANALQKYKL